MDRKFDEKDAQVELERRYKEATVILQDQDKLERFLQRLEKKLRVIPKAGDTLALIPSLVSLVRNYAKKEYSEIPIGSIVAIISALIYVLSPIDIIPDVIPGAGYIDDALVIATCMKLVKADVDEYLEWRKSSGRDLIE